MSKALLAAVALLLAASGLATVAALKGTYPLALFSYHVVSQISNSNVSMIQASGNVTVMKPAVINLGNITAGQKGNYTAVAEIAVNSSGWFEVELNDSLLKGVFSNFVVKLTIGNQTVTLATGGHGKGHDEARIYLTKGDYNVTIVIHYVVSPHPENRTVTNGALLSIGPYHSHDHDDHDHGNENK